MIKAILVASLLLCVCWSGTVTTGTCPNPVGQMYNGQLTISLTGDIQLVTGTDAICYNYTLPEQFKNRPGVAVAVNDLQSQYSSDLFFSIKPYLADDFGVIPFVVRTQWKYTTWTQIKFSFFAEDRDHIEAGYYQVDSGSLAGCVAGKDISVLLPFRTYFTGAIQASTFLHGFQMTSNKVFGSFSPFEVQIINQQVNVTGVAVTISVTTATQIQSLFISYIAIDSTLTFAYLGNYLYSSYNPIAQLSHAPTTDLSSNIISFYGFNGFIVSNNQAAFQLSSVWNGLQFSFTTKSNYIYLSYNYFFYLGGPCTDCKGYPIYYNKNCVAYCPTGSYYNGQTCVVCLASQTWNGTNCVDRCSSGKVWDVASSSCICPKGQFWNGYACIVCPNGKTWNSYSNQCDCPVSSTWNGVTCVTCTGGKIYSNQTNSCQCPNGQTFNGYICTITCPTGQIYNETIKKCACPTGQNWNGNLCVYCFGGQVWNASSLICTCTAGTVWNGYSCNNPCNGGRIIDSTNNQCVCPTGNWNGVSCVICTGNQVWSTSTQSCVCATGNWNGVACITCSANQVWYPANLACGCPSNQNWNGISCITCPPGQNWNAANRICGCPSGSNWNGNTCVTCSGGRIWSSSLLSCNCPSGQNWNGFACITCATGQNWSSKTLSCGCQSGYNWNGLTCVTCSSGRTWSFPLNSCVCPNNGNWNGTNCITCQTGTYWNGNNTCVSCSGGRVWNIASLACECPVNTQWDGSNCSQYCTNGQILVKGVCGCPAGQFLENGTCYNNPSCQPGYTWIDKNCVPISCSSGASYVPSCSCCQVPTYQCPSGAYWDGYRCVSITQTCPIGMVWDNVSCCISNGSQCANGTYLNSNGTCSPISSQCPTGLVWKNNQCVPTSNTCPAGSYFNGNQCTPYVSCTQGQIWNQTLSQCVCPSTGFWNGNTCISCGGDQTYTSGGCFCPSGKFYNGTHCVTQNSSSCVGIPNTNWNGTACVCFQGFTNINGGCSCQGLLVGAFCDRCYTKPNSTFVNGICQCNNGFVDLNGTCVPSVSVNIDCTAGTYFDNQVKRCLPCSDGCLGCISCYACTQCRPQYTFVPSTGLCQQICGDGFRFSLPCDDGNNVDGDGCSKSCQIEVGFSCYGGSPNTKDTCTKAIPSAITFTSGGQSHLYGKIVINVQLNYLPLALINSATDCQNNCNNVLSVNLTNGFTSYTSISARYIPTTSFSFSIEIDFGRQPIGIFTAVIGINQSLRTQYFSGVDISKSLTLQINPAYLALTYKDDNASLK